MDFKMFVNLVIEKLNEAGIQGDKGESVRLLRLIISECDVQIRKLQGSDV